jgi:ketosteroid isomerase-like protein
VTAARVIAVDWSGAAEGGRGRICTAEVVEGRLIALDRQRGRDATADHLIEQSKRTPHMVVGLDFAFSFPRWFVEEAGVDGIEDFWEHVERQGPTWLADCRAPFWGKKGSKDPKLREPLRATEGDLRERTGFAPKSVFQLFGAGTVGAGSLRGIPILRRLREAGFSIWPFHAAGWPRVVEIYPRALTGSVRKSDAGKRRRHLREYLEKERLELDAGAFEDAVKDEHAFDAVVSAFEMWANRSDLSALDRLADPGKALEGEIWLPPRVRLGTRVERSGKAPARRPRAAAAPRRVRAPAPAAEPPAGAEAVVLRFVERINAHDADGLAELMSADHAFVDALGRRHKGRDAMREGWRGFFEHFPGYRIEAARALASGQVVALFGTASGGYRVEGRVLQGRRWEVPAAWSALVSSGLVAEWQVYCDTRWPNPQGVSPV